jgi:hypothetical protein
VDGCAIGTEWASEDVDAVAGEGLGLGALPPCLEGDQLSGGGLGPTLVHPGVGVRGAAVLLAEHLSNGAEEAGVEAGHRLVDFVGTTIRHGGAYVQG